MPVDSPNKPSLIQSLVPIIALMALLSVNVLLIYGDNALSGANQLALLFAASIAAVIAKSIGFTWRDILEGVTNSISTTLPALIILLLIGALSGTWLISGVVPAMIYYGLELLNPTFFLFAACIVCAIVSIATGSSWSTIATVGIALLAIGKALGIHEGIVAGAIISGAYFGDKMSPLSDTTNLAPAIVGTDLITHIKYMTYTTIPSICIALLIFLIVGFYYEGGIGSSEIAVLKASIASKFHISPWLFLVPVTVIVLILKKMPAIPALFIGSLVGGVFALFFQPQILTSLAQEPNLYIASYKSIIDAMSAEVQITTDNELVNELFTSGGMSGMLNTIWLIICAMTFGGIMEKTGMLEKITSSIISKVESNGSLIMATATSCIGTNITASDQYLSIILPGKMFEKKYKEQGLHPKVLSRTLEDSGTVTSPLIPWNTCGAYHSGILGVATGDYFIYCFFNILSPLVTILYGFLGIKIAKADKTD